MKSRVSSARLFDRGRAVMPDGVSSPMRTFSLVGGNPIIVASAYGSRVTDVDGNVYVDFLNAFGALVLGHAHEHVTAAVIRQVQHGTVYGLSTELEYLLAERIVQSTPALEQLRFVCSGTEAVMTAVRIARAHTGRSTIVKFRGSYHGHSDALLAGPQNVASDAVKAKGVTRGITATMNQEVVLCDYNDAEQLEQIFSAQGDTVAAVLVEPFATNMGFVKPQAGFLPAIRKLCSRHGALFIFDEVVTGFRFGWGGACNSLDIDPDLVTFGKIIGGGTPVGAFAGKKIYMQDVAIGGPVFQSGTFAANPLTMAAGNAVLDVLAQPGFYDELEEKGAILQSAIEQQFSARRIPFVFSRHGALAGIAYRDNPMPLKSYEDVKTQRYDVHKAVHARVLERGYLMPPSLEEPLFISAALSADELRSFAKVLAESIESVLLEAHRPFASTSRST